MTTLTALLGVVLACSDPTGVQPAGGTHEPPPDSTPSTTQVGFVPRTVVESGTTYKYQVFVPHGYDAKKKWPLILYLHGNGERGSDGELQTRVGLGPAVRAQEATFPAIVLFPQVPLGEGAHQIMIRLANDVLAAALRDYNVDPTRIYLTGVSMGAIWGWDLPLADPARFAAIVPVSGGVCIACFTGDPSSDPAPVYASIATKLRSEPVWIFHGSADQAAPVTVDRALVQAFKDAGAPDIRYTEYAGMDHNVWDRAYAEPTLWTWLFAKHR
ncbi:MAG TPA: hypothetical protein VFQ38_03035 [Longimicrobiales bacterium]|nr:hypothetical protein [Longimicrobiales bacterium]